jgi:hypothetical protein
VQTLRVLEVTVAAPSLLVVTLAKKISLKTGLEGMFKIVGGFGMACAPAGTDHRPTESMSRVAATTAR